MQHISYSFRPEPDVLRFFRGKRAASAPGEFRFQTWNLKYRSAFWLDITALIMPLQVASVHAQFFSPSMVRISTQNVRALQLNFPQNEG